MTCRIIFQVPSDCVPALIGLGGSKVEDTQRKSETDIKFSKFSDVLHSVSVSGFSVDNCNLAKRIIVLAVNHHLAALKTLPPNTEFPGEAEARLDAQTFFAEVMHRKA